MITIRDRVIAFFLGAPDEELTAADIATRWSVSPGGVYDALSTMLDDGLLKGRQSSGRGRPWLYRPTRRLLDLGKGTP